MERYLTKSKKRLMLKALKDNNGDIERAAVQAGIHRRTHYDWINKDSAYRTLSNKFTCSKWKNKTKAKKQLMLTALKDNNGVIKYAAKQANISVRTHQHWIKSDPAYRSHALKRTLIGNGYVYVVHCKGTTFYKIGITKKNNDDRLYDLQIGCPFELEMIYVIDSIHYKQMEKEIHHRFKDRWIRGEWFDLDEVSLDTVIQYLEETHQPHMQAQRQMQIDFQG